MSRRVAVFAPSLAGGGAERAMLDVARGLAERGLPVDLVLVRAEGPYLDLLPDEVRLMDLRARHSLTSLFPLLRYLRRERPGALLSVLAGTNAAALLAKKLFARGLWTVVRRASTFTPDYAASGFRTRMVMRLEKYLLPSADAILVPSRGAADDLARSVPGASHLVRVVHNPVVWPDHAARAGMPVEHPWFRDPDVPVILSAGRLVALKGHASLLRAFAELVRSRPARLVVLGEGPERRGLMDLARDLEIERIVDFPGFHVNPLPYMTRAGVFVLPSTYEGFPNALVQAMACGTPVVSTDCPSGPGEILEDGRWGRLVPVNDPGSLAAAIRETLDDPIRPDLLIARANAYSAEAAIDRYMEIVARVENPLPGRFPTRRTGQE